MYAHSTELMMQANEAQEVIDGNDACKNESFQSPYPPPLHLQSYPQQMYPQMVYPQAYPMMMIQQPQYAFNPCAIPMPVSPSTFVRPDSTANPCGILLAIFNCLWKLAETVIFGLFLHVISDNRLVLIGILVLFQQEYLLLCFRVFSSACLTIFFLTTFVNPLFLVDKPSHFKMIPLLLGILCEAFTIFNIVVIHTALIFYTTVQIIVAISFCTMIYYIVLWKAYTKDDARASSRSICKPWSRNYYKLTRPTAIYPQDI